MVGRGTAAGKSPKARLSSVANAMRVVKAFSDDEYEIGISNLARRLALPKSTVGHTHHGFGKVNCRVAAC